MSSLIAQLSSITSSLDELTGRVAGLAEQEQQAKHEQTAIELDEAERSLRAGIRRLERLLRTL